MADRREGGRTRMMAVAPVAPEAMVVMMMVVVVALVLMMRRFRRRRRRRRRNGRWRRWRDLIGTVVGLCGMRLRESARSHGQRQHRRQNAGFQKSLHRTDPPIV
jgi:hypothetical protein